jgi:LmbE family N-acetylglucosaminyl deacetylase
VGPIVVLSPHLDDAVFSCWHVLASSQDVAAINVFAAVPPAGANVPPWDRMTGAEDSSARMRARLEEDRAALAIAGRAAEQLDFLESQYRDGAPEGLLAALEPRLPRGARMLAPAAIGGHSDHVLVRDAALALATEGRTVSLYADIPYATEFGWPAWMTGREPDPFEDIDAYWSQFVPEVYEPQPVELGEDQQRAKARAMRSYRSQFAMLEAQGQRRLTHPELLRFELVWIRRS